MGDRYMNDFAPVQDATYIYAEDANSNQCKISTEKFEKRGSTSTLGAVRLPGINDEATKVASLYRGTGYYNASFFISADLFGLSFFGIIGMGKIGETTSYFAKLSKESTNGSANVLFVERGEYTDVYISGSYGSAYSMTTSSLFSQSEFVSLKNIGEIVKIASLSVKTSLVI